MIKSQTEEPSCIAHADASQASVFRCTGDGGGVQNGASQAASGDNFTFSALCPRLSLTAEKSFRSGSAWIQERKECGLQVTP